MQSKSFKDSGGQLPRDREDFRWKGLLEASAPNPCSQMGWAGTKSRWGCSGLSPGKECSFPSWPGTPIPVLKYPWRQGKGFLMFSYKFLVAACDHGSTHRSSKLLVHGSYPPVDLSWFQTSAASLYWGRLLITWQLQDIHKNTAIPIHPTLPEQGNECQVWSLLSAKTYIVLKLAEGGPGQDMTLCSDPQSQAN